MKKYFFLALGGFIGANSRYLIKSLAVETLIPWHTYFVNILGSFLLALIFTIVIAQGTKDVPLILGITTGFLGAFTTFSTFCGEIYHLLSQGNWLWAEIYSDLSLCSGLLAIFLGVALGKKITTLRRWRQ